MNVSTKLDGKRLIITVDVSEDTVKKASLSKSGKNKLVASTDGGFAPVTGLEGFRMNLNVIAPK